MNAIALAREASKAMIDDAKSRDLGSFLVNVVGAGVTRLRSNIPLSFNCCPKCGFGRSARSDKVSLYGDKLEQWRCWQCDAKGTIIDAAIFYWSLGSKDVTEAAARITGQSRQQYVARQLPVAKPVPAADPADVRQAIQRICQLSTLDDPTALQYLINTRCIPKELVLESRRRGMLGFLPSDPTVCKASLQREVGEDVLYSSGLWNPDKKSPGIAFKPLVFFLPGGSSAEFRVVKPIQEGQNKLVRYGALQYPWFWIGSTSECLVVEGPIDMLSAVAMGWNGFIMALPGIGNYGRTQWYLNAAAKYGIRRWVIGFDNDSKADGSNPGQEHAVKLAALFDELSFCRRTFVPPLGMDLNDILKKRVLETRSPVRVAA